MMKPDYARIAELERDIFGEAQTVPVQPPSAAAHELDAVLREYAGWLFLRRPMAELDGSRWAAASRLVVLGLLGFAAVWLCLGIAGVVPWGG